MGTFCLRLISFLCWTVVCNYTAFFHQLYFLNSQHLDIITCAHIKRMSRIIISINNWIKRSDFGLLLILDDLNMCYVQLFCWFGNIRNCHRGCFANSVYFLVTMFISTFSVSANNCWSVSQHIITHLLHISVYICVKHHVMDHQYSPNTPCWDWKKN